MDIQLEQYRLFECVARNKSFSAAASELYITQPAVSQGIKQLEKRLEVILFIRGQRGVTLTDAGRDLLLYVSEAIRLLQNAENHLNQLKTLEHGQLNIGASDTLCRHYLLPFLSRFRREYPGVKLRITNRTSGETVELLKNGRVDIGFINMPTVTDEDISVKELVVLHDIFVCNRDYKNEGSMKELKKAPLMMLETGSSTRRYVESEYRKLGIQLKPQIELGSHDLLLSFAEAGIGLAAVVKEYSEESLKTGTLTEVKLFPEIPPRSIALIINSRIPLTAAAKEFIAMLA